MEIDNKYKYFAFISYKREDEKWAKWLQHKLEHFKLPYNLNGRTDLPKEIRPVFRDQSELAGGVLAEEIQNALENSKYLIVICSPRAAQSQWVGKEVQSFISMGRIDRIIPFIVGGTVRAQNSEDECFPFALLNLPPNQELLGINIDEMGRDAAAVKVVARMFGLKFDTLWQRHEREQKKRKNWVVAACVAGFLAMVGIAGWIWKQNIEIKHQNKEIKEKDWKMMENQARFVAEKANNLVDEGDSYTAQRLLLEVLPTKEHPERPYTVEAEAAFRKACNNNTSIFRGHTYVVGSIAFSPDDSKIVSTGWDCSSYVWDVGTGMGVKLGEETGTHASGESCFSPDGKHILTVGFEVKIFDAQTLQKIKTLDMDAYLIESAAYSPDGKRIFVSTDSDIQVFDAITFRPLSTLGFKNDRLTIHSFSPDGKRLCCFENYGESGACIIDIGTGEKLVTIDEDDINAMTFNPTGEIVATASWNGTVKLWDSRIGELIRTIKVGNAVVNDVVFSPNGDFIATASWDEMVRLWRNNKRNDEPIKEYKGHDGRVLSLSFNSDGSLLASSSWDKTIRIWDIFGFRPMISETEARYDRKVYYSPDGKKEAIVSWGKPVKVISMETGVVLYELPEDTWQVHTVDFSPDGKTIATASQDHSVRIWNANDGRELMSFSHGGIVYAAVFSPNGKYIASGTDIPDRKIRIWDVQNDSLYTTFDLNESIYTLAYSPDGHYLACVLADETLHVYETTSWIDLVNYDISYSVHDKSAVVFKESSIVVTTNGYQLTYDFPPLQELVEQTRDRFKNDTLTKEERRLYYLE